MTETNNRLRARQAVWTLCLTLSLACSARRHSRAPAPLNPAGMWEGEVRVGETTLPLTVSLASEGSGWRGMVNLQSHYALEYPLRDVEFNDQRISFAFADLLPPATFDGLVERGRIRGEFRSQLPADTLRGTFDLWRRPPAAVPYSADEARFRNAELELAGTVFRPRTPGRHPAIVFVHGSGPQTRDSYIRWFADRFARAGFVTLIYDKRGTGASGGERWPRTVGSFGDLAEDALAAVRYLRKEPAVEPTRIGVWGLSQGAWIAALAAMRGPESVGFLVMLSGGGVSPAEQELYDDEVKLRDLGFDEAAIAEALSYLRLADQYVRTQSDDDWNRFATAREEARRRPWYPYLDRFPQILPREAPLWRGLRTDLDYDPTPALRTLRVPVLAVLGEEDRLTPARETAQRIRGALEDAGNRQLTVQLLPGADHALMVKPAGNASWLAERPVDDWVAQMIAWARALW
ncbi:MAG TPA: alpha/beta fold hydrolase [Gemmatimonadales bacterium]